MTESQALQSTAALKSLASRFTGNLLPTVLGPVALPPTKKKKLSKSNAGKKKKDFKSRPGE